MKSEDTPHISPQTAMDDYFQDMLGHVSEDPLKKLEAQEQAELKKAQSLQPETKVGIERTKIKPKRMSKQSLATDFADPKPVNGNISPLIIAAAFPKLAPVALEATVSVEKTIEVKPNIKLTETTGQLEVNRQKTASKTKPLISTQQKLDKKTALSILLQKQQKLSKAQRLRLKEKMQQLERKKQLAQQQLAVQVAEVKQDTPLQSPPEVKPAISLKPTLVTSEKTQHATASNTEHSLQAQAALSKNARPDWSERRFECLLFSVAGLKLAVPLISLGAIYKIEKDFTPLVGRASWFMGLYHHLERNVRVVDTAQWVMPERCTQQVRSNYKFIIRLGSSDWGMACDAVHQSIQLYPDQVKWRSERTKRVWLYGTVIEHMCALIDADALNSMLEQQAPINFSH